MLPMRAELLVFDLLLLTVPLVASLARPSHMLDRLDRVALAAVFTSLPAWGVLAALGLGGGLSFAPEHSTSATLAILGLPLGAWLGAPIAAFAALFCWIVGFAGESPARPLALARRSNTWLYLGAMALLGVALEGALLQRGVMTRAPIWPAKLINVPLEDLGLLMVFAALAVLAFEGLQLRAAARGRKGWISRWIEGRFGGYRHSYAEIDTSVPERLEQPKRVAVVGAGLAGMGAASRLAERGFAVHLYERNDYLGGKVGAWKTTLPDGREVGMTHGFHAFFKQYYNLDIWLEELGVNAHRRSVGDYMILTLDGRSYSFAKIATTPILNLLSLARHGVYKLREVAKRTTGLEMEALMRYDSVQTFAEFDEVSYAQFAAEAGLPESLQLVFNTFSRAFFSDADKMSMAALIKSFHYYYLSNDGGLIYDFLDDDYEPILLAPIRTHMLAHGVEISTGRAVDSITRGPEGGYEIDGERFDYLVVAADVVGTRALFEASPSLQAAAPETARKAATLRPGQRYVVWRVWLDRKLERELPGFVVTERVELLDSLTLVHQNERESGEWVREREAEGLEGSVLELHCYSLSEDHDGDEGDLRAAFLTELHRFCPELDGAEVIHEYFYVRRDFPSFHVGQHKNRPSWDTELDDLFLAGDWVDLPFPAMLMEAAYTSGLLAANAISRREGVREMPVWTVPLRGFMADWPQRPF